MTEMRSYIGNNGKRTTENILNYLRSLIFFICRVTRDEFAYIIFKVS